ncbi:peptidoglycan editing factor PgeF [Snodgrassella communis]|uniref:peptidoglycan editing factor PgeF n=1 Tax=Snodgrassella communis TaxID=2946699 RepID=UPI000C1EB4E0
MNQWDMNQALGLTKDKKSFFEAEWPASANVHTLISTRQGGVSRPPFTSLNVGAHVGDVSEAVQHNRALVQQQVAKPLAYLNQVHSAEVIDAMSALNALQAGWPEAADASFCRQGEVVACAIMTADCLPVLMCDRAGTVVAAAHAGWRGLANGVLQNTVEAMQINPVEILAYLGPAIGPEAFEIGVEVWEAFCLRQPKAQAAFADIGNDHYLADIYALARLALADAGVHQVYGGTECTGLQRERYFSYRRDGQTGRMLSAIWLD